MTAKAEEPRKAITLYLPMSVWGLLNRMRGDGKIDSVNGYIRYTIMKDLKEEIVESLNKETWEK